MKLKDTIYKSSKAWIMEDVESHSTSETIDLTSIKPVCSVCLNEKGVIDFLYCKKEGCLYKICHGCMSFQITKFLSKYDYTWTGPINEEIVVDENNDKGGINWACPSCQTCSVISETDLMLCANTKTMRDDALSILKE